MNLLSDTSMSTIFTKIIKGEIPSYRLFEDEYTYAFLDNKPHNLGHTLIVPKVEIGYYADLPEPYFSSIFQNSKLIGKAIQQSTGCFRVGLMIHGMGVPEHMHLHLIPLFGVEDINTNKAETRSQEEMASIQSKILREIEVIINNK